MASNECQAKGLPCAGMESWTAVEVQDGQLVKLLTSDSMSNLLSGLGTEPQSWESPSGTLLETYLLRGEGWLSRPSESKESTWRETIPYHFLFPSGSRVIVGVSFHEDGMLLTLIPLLLT